MNLNIVNFTKNKKHVSIEHETNKAVKGSQNDTVILPSSSDDDSFFVLRSLKPKKKKKESNVK